MTFDKILRQRESKLSNNRQKRTHGKRGFETLGYKALDGEGELS